MNKNHIYLIFTTLITPNICLATNLNDVDDSLVEFAKKLSLSEVLADEETKILEQVTLDIPGINLALEKLKNPTLHVDELLTENQKLPEQFKQPEEVFSSEETEEAILLEEFYFNDMKKENVIHKKPNDKIKIEIVNDITANDIAILDNLFKKINKTYNDDLKNIERLFFENDTLLHYLDNIFVYDEPEVVLAERANITVEALRNLKERADARLEQIKILAKEQGILAPKEQKENMIVEFMKEKKCSRIFAEKTYKQFIGED
ncbi:MAG: hypothetical protein BGO77_05075 [Caedibacter sp. 37-49]|nr:MAG: hypothetical protein BGO77_05075 [Caedibacter sp. 37-49]